MSNHLACYAGEMEDDLYSNDLTHYLKGGGGGVGGGGKGGAAVWKCLHACLSRSPQDLMLFRKSLRSVR